MHFMYEGEKLNLLFREYASNRATRIDLVGEDGGPYCVLTVNLDVKPKNGEFFIKTWSENAEVARAALASGLFVDTGKRIMTNRVEAQVWALAQICEACRSDMHQICCEDFRDDESDKLMCSCQKGACDPWEINAEITQREKDEKEYKAELKKMRMPYV